MQCRTSHSESMGIRIAIRDYWSSTAFSKGVRCTGIPKCYNGTCDDTFVQKINLLCFYTRQEWLVWLRLA